MIGVIGKNDEIPVIEEFFQLFKTPWEIYQAGRQYDVVLVTADEIPDVDSRLLLVYRSLRHRIDARHEVTISAQHRGLRPVVNGLTLPLYGNVATFGDSKHGIACVGASPNVAGLRFASPQRTILRLGYDLFEEVRFLLAVGQPIETADVPTLDSHIALLRQWILDAGLPLLEVPPTPSGHGFIVCLTHDIDFIGIRQHRFDHSMWGFLFRSTVGAARDLVRRRVSIGRLFRAWKAAASLPFVYLGWLKDFWEPFGWYLQVETGLPATYYVIPFKGRPGTNVPGPRASRRATAYDIGDLARWAIALKNQGCEVGVHGIDAWRSVHSGREELARVVALTGDARVGIRIHWLLHDSNTFALLDQAGYVYDTTGGYNDTIGYRHGTTQVFRPLNAKSLLELPLHIQDGALFFPDRLDLSESEAWTRCAALISRAQTGGGVLTVLWHDRSHAAERFWGDFYIRLVDTLRASDAWFGTAAQVAGWFERRRLVRFERVETPRGEYVMVVSDGNDDVMPPLTLRIQRPDATSAVVDMPWNGQTVIRFDASLADVETFPRGHASAGLQMCSGFL
jgi:hypothetical protein